MRLSVVIPAHNCADHVGVLLDSLVRQTLDEGVSCEFIAVNDGSSDATAEVLCGFPWLKVLHHDHCRGAGAARNTGARAAHGELLLFLDADTRVRAPDFLRRCIAFFDEKPDYDAVSGCYYDDNRGDGAFSRYLDVCEAAMRVNGLDRPAPGTLSGSVCAIRRAVFMSLGGFSEDSRQALEDPELGCRLAAAGHKLWLSGNLRVEHRQPGFLHYVKELLPRSRHYVQLIRRYRIFNPMMGGAHEGLGRGALVGGLLLMAAGAVLPPLIAAGAAALMLAAWYSRQLITELVRKQGMAFLPTALAFHAATSAAVAAGGLLALKDIAFRSVRGALIDAAVVLAYVRSLLSRSSPGYLIQFLTHRCNAHCGHCFDGPQRQAIGHDAEMDLARIRRLAASVGPLGHLSLTGGEPLLRDDLADIISAYYLAGVRSVSVSTNGSYPDKLAQLVARLPAVAPFARVMVTVSVDGVGATHDELRGVPGLFARVERSLRLLCEARQWLPQLRVHACIAVTAANAISVDAVLAHLRRFRLDQLELTRLRGQPADLALGGVDDERYAHLSACVAEANGRATGLSRLFSTLDRAMFSVVRSPHAPWPCGTCLAGRRLAVIHADGTVLPCEMIRDVRPAAAAQHDEFVIGRLGDYSDDLRAVLGSVNGRRITDYIRGTQCRCSFECAIFATMAYRPWTLPRFLLRGAFARQQSAPALRSGNKTAPQQPEEKVEKPRGDLARRRLAALSDPEPGRKRAREYPVFFMPRAAAAHVRPHPGGSRNDQRKAIQQGEP